MQLGISNISPIVASPCRSWDCYVQTNVLAIENQKIQSQKIKTAHNPKSKCHKKTMNIHKITYRIKIIPPKPCLLPNK